MSYHRHQQVQLYPSMNITINPFFTIDLFDVTRSYFQLSLMLAFITNCYQNQSTLKRPETPHEPWHFLGIYILQNMSIMLISQLYLQCQFPNFISNVYFQTLSPMLTYKLYLQCLFPNITFNVYFQTVSTMFISKLYLQCLFPNFIYKVYFPTLASMLTSKLLVDFHYVFPIFIDNIYQQEFMSNVYFQRLFLMLISNAYFNVRKQSPVHFWLHLIQFTPLTVLQS